MWNLGANMYILYGPQEPYMCCLLYAYAFKANTRHDMLLHGHETHEVWEKFYSKPVAFILLCLRALRLMFACVIPGKNRVPNEDELGGARGRC